MTVDPDSLSLADAARTMAALGAPPDVVEEEIVSERPWLVSEHRAALWLLAWCVAERPGGRSPPTRRVAA